MINKNNLSDIEIKLINAALKFSKGRNYSVEIERHYKYKGNKSTIKLTSSDESLGYVLGIHYSDNAKKGDIVLDGIMKFAREYKSYLTKKIPEIKNRTWLID
jgi:hypothetical protein